MKKTIWTLMLVFCLLCTAHAAVIFEDDFTGNDGDPLNSEKWTTGGSAQSTVDIQTLNENNYACINAPQGFYNGNFIAKTTADFFADGAVATYSIDFVESNMNLYGHRRMSVIGDSASVILEWTTGWTGSVSYNTYTLSITDLGTVWTSDTINWDTGRNLTLTLTPTTYEISVAGASTASGSATGLHGLSADDFTNGGLWMMRAESSSSKDEVIYFDNAQIDYIVPEPASLGLIGIGALCVACRRRLA